MSANPKARLLTGDRPTGRLHLGHYVGSIRNRVALQSQYECFFIIADLHMLSTKNSREEIEASVDLAQEMVLDQLSCGIEPEGVSFYLQSAVPELHELYTLLQSLVSVPRLSRIPSLKDMLQSSSSEEMPFALLGYPVLQSADILSAKAQWVPVGKDNLAHIEITREIARRFNDRYGETFPIPEALSSECPSLIGTDGKAKMSKSLGNAIYLSDSSEEVRKKVFSMYTDPNRTRADIPGQVEGNPVFAYHEAFNTQKEEVESLKARYREGKVGDTEVKERLFLALERFLTPVRERRVRFSKKGFCASLIEEGTHRMRELTKSSVHDARKAMGLVSSWNRIHRKAEVFHKDTPSGRS